MGDRALAAVVDVAEELAQPATLDVMRRMQRAAAITCIRLADVRDQLAEAQAQSRASSPQRAKEILDAATRAAVEALGAIGDELRKSLGPFDGLQVADAATYLGVSEATVRTWLRHGALRAVTGEKPVQVELDSLRRLNQATQGSRTSNP